MNKERFEREYGQEYQEKMPEDIVGYGIQRRMEGYELEADVYAMKKQREANELKGFAQEIQEAEG